MASSISRRRVIQGTAWATPIVIASSAVPVYASSREKCVPDISVPVNQNLTNDGSSTLEAFTIPAGVETVTFRITGGVGGSYRGLAMHGSGGRGALITGTLAVKENDVLKFVLAGGGAYNRDKPTEPGKGWANGGSHGPSYKTTDARTVKFFEGPTLPRNTTALRAVAHLRYSSMTNSLPSPVEVAERELGSTPTPYGTICSPAPSPKSFSLSFLKQPKLPKAAAAALETAQMAAHSLRSTSSSPVPA